MSGLLLRETVERPLYDDQSAGIDNLRDSLRRGKRRPVLQAPTGFGKCLGRGTPVLLITGDIKLVEEIIEGDELIGPDSEPRTVLSIASGREMLYRVTPTKGESYVVNESHILSLKMTPGCQARSSINPGRDGGDFVPGKIINLSIGDYLGRSSTFRHCAKGWRSPAKFLQEDVLLLSPYILGLWLGDGASRDPEICTGDPEIADAFVRYMEDMDLEVVERPNSENSRIYAVRARSRNEENRFLRMLRTYEVLRDKHIPLAYKAASERDRLELLAGIIDTDGHYNVRGVYEITLGNERLFDDVVFVARSLGFAAYKKRIEKTCHNNGVTGIYWQTLISGDLDRIPCRVARKKASPRLQKKDPLVVGISVEAIGEGDYFGFELDGDGLFLLGDFTVTHNTRLAAEVLKLAREKDRRVVFTVPRIDLVDQTMRSFWEEGIGDIGVIQADHHETDAKRPIQIASVQSLVKRGRPETDLVIVDEAHIAFEFIYAWMDDPEWRKVPFIGLSATPWAKNMGLHYDDLIIAGTTKDLIAKGRLSDFRVMAPSHPDLKGVRTRMGDYEEKYLSAVMSKPQLVADVVDTWLDKADRQPTLVFAVDLAHAQHLQRRFEQAGVRCGYQDAKTPPSDRADIRRQFHTGALEVVCNVGTLTTGVDWDVRCISLARPTKSEILYCLDKETEVLTSQGWKGKGQIEIGDCAAALADAESGRGEWSAVRAYVDRAMYADEKWVSYKAPRADFQVTGGHSMIYRTTPDQPFRRGSALEMARFNNGVQMPTAVEIPQPGMPLTDDELYFIGMMMTDGTWTRTLGAITQSERHPEIIERIEKCLRGCGIGYAKRRVAVPKEGEIKERFARWRFDFSVGKPRAHGNTGRGPQPTKTAAEHVEGVTGFLHLMPFLDKDFAAPLMALSRGQFLTLLQGIHDGDGFKMKSPSVDWVPRSWTLCSSRKLFVDRLQALAAINGFTANLRGEQGNSRKRPIWVLTITPQAWRNVGGSGMRPQVTVRPATDENVWCVETAAGTIVTRRHGKVTVMGNCQIIGRGLRTAPGKKDLLILDHSDTTLRLGFVTDIHHTELDVGREKGPEREKPLPKECKSCHTLMPPRTMTCPNCGTERPKPEPKANTVENRDGELVEYGRDGGTLKVNKSSRHVKLANISIPFERMFAQLRYYGITHGYKDGWAAQKYKAATGKWPANEMKNIQIEEPCWELSSWIRSTNIRWAKSKANPRNNVRR